MTQRRRLALTLTSAFLLAVAAGCHKKTTPPPPPPAPAPPPPAPQPAINFFTAEPDTISTGQPSSLRWSVSNATSVQIDQGIGSVSPDGRRAVYPTSSTTYTLTASGGGGSAHATATITVSTPPPPAAAPKQETASPQQILTQQVHDIHFEYDKSDIRPEDQPVLQADAVALKTIFSMDPNFIITVEGHCDERGSAEYNLALGDRRASATKDALIALGIPGDRLRTISYGKERPLCTDATEECYARNRRAHFSAGQ
ncbi:MAG: OmpA family protein [Acidobacteriaceae bacterium]|nr:OmpA family protein [Acidobacteriaceae bacterium]